MLPLEKLQGCWTKGCDRFNLSRLKRGVLLQSYRERNSWKDAARAGIALCAWESSRDLKQGSSGLVFPNVLWAIPSSFPPFPKGGDPKVLGCTQGSLLLARIPCSNGGCLRDESLLAAAARRVLFRCFFRLPPLDFIHQGGDCVWEECPPLPPALCCSSARQDQAPEVGD